MSYRGFNPRTDNFLGDLWDDTGGKVVSYVDDAWDATNESGDDSYLERFLDTAGSIGLDMWHYDVPGLSTNTNVNPITGARYGLNWLGDALRPFTPDAFEEWMDNFEANSPIVQWPDRGIIQPLERIIDAAVSPHEQEWVQNLGSWVNENVLGQPSSQVNFTEDDYATLMDQIAGMDFADPFMQDEIIRATMGDLEDVSEDKSTGVGWDPNGLTNLLQDQIAFIKELTAAGILNVEDARAATGQSLDEVWGELQAGFQSELDDLVAGDEAAAASLGATTDSIAADLADMGVDAAVLDPERRAMEEMMAMQASNEMNFAEGLIDSAAFGQADRLSSMNLGMDDLVLGLEMGQLSQIGQLENMADVAQIQGSAMGVDPMLVLADMLSGTSVAQQMAAGNASAAAAAAEDEEVWQNATWLAGTNQFGEPNDPRFAGDPMAAYLVLTNQLSEKGYALPDVDPQILPFLLDEILAITQENQNINPGVNAYDIAQAGLMAELQAPVE
jgi:hypothetical protein